MSAFIHGFDFAMGALLALLVAAVVIGILRSWLFWIVVVVLLTFWGLDAVEQYHHNHALHHYSNPGTKTST